MEEQLSAGLCERQMAELIESGEVKAGHVIGETSLFAATGPRPKAVHQIDGFIRAARTASLIEEDRLVVGTEYFS